MLARDEAHNLPGALGSVPPGSVMLVIDAQSQDATVDCAQRLGAEVIVRPWEGFVATRRFALGEVRTPWTFMLDADERLDADLRASLGALVPASGTDGYCVRRSNRFCGRTIAHGAWGSDAPLRFFRTARATLVAEPASGGGAELHERWVVPGDVAELGGRLVHESYPSLGAYGKKFSRYTSIEASGLPPSLRLVLINIAKALPRFVFAFVARAGWRDGWRGAFIAAASAVYPVVASGKALGRRA